MMNKVGVDDENDDLEPNQERSGLKLVLEMKSPKLGTISPKMGIFQEMSPKLGKKSPKVEIFQGTAPKEGDLL